MVKILLIEDNDEDADVIQDTLCRELPGIAISRVIRAEAGLDLIHSNQYACVLLDLDLPGMSGLDLLEWIGQTKLNAPPIIVVTGRGDESKAVRAMHLGASDYISKSALQDSCLAMTLQNTIGDREKRTQDGLAAAKKEVSEIAQESLTRLGSNLSLLKSVGNI